MPAFQQILGVDIPETVLCEAASGRAGAFAVVIRADGEIPFPQVILREAGREILVRGAEIRGEADGKAGEWLYQASIPAGALGPGRHRIQVEGCRRSAIEAASSEDWIKHS